MTNNEDRIGTHGVGCETWGHRHYECALRRIEELEAALSVFAAIKPSDLHPADGSEAERYVIMLHDPKALGQGAKPDFTGADLARARAAIAKAERLSVIEGG